jgi:glycerol-1-phosphate dehydrogenase [NAD(P)+]
LANNIAIYTGEEAIAELIRYCEAQHLNRFMLVADRNTYRVLGQTVEAALKERGCDVNTVVLTGEEIAADEHFIVQVLTRADQEVRTYLAIGSGTVTDITRFASHRTRTNFISIPTAPSVDGSTARRHLRRSAHAVRRAAVDDRGGLRRYVGQVHLVGRLAVRPPVVG